VTTYADAAHEARHVVSAWFVGGLRVDFARIGIHAADEGIVRWGSVGGDTGAGPLIASLCGWLNDPDLPERAIWPPPYPPPEWSADHVGTLTKLLNLSREQYEGICRIAVELVENEEFKQAVELVARALMVAPSIDHEGLELLRAETGFAEEPEVVLA
jgi:hypothetical protein